MLPGLAALPPFRKPVTPSSVTLTTGSGNWPLPAIYNEIFVEGWGGGGSGGSSASVASGTGTDTTFGPCTAGGGAPGSSVVSTGGVVTPGGSGAGIATGGDQNFQGNPGGDGMSWNYAGSGGDAPDGGGAGAIGKTVGGQKANPASAPGGGGAGKLESVQSTSFTGAGGQSGGKFKRTFRDGELGASVPYSIGVGGKSNGNASDGARGELRITVS